MKTDLKDEYHLKPDDIISWEIPSSGTAGDITVEVDGETGKPYVLVVEGDKAGFVPTSGLKVQLVKGGTSDKKWEKLTTSNSGYFNIKLHGFDKYLTVNYDRSKERKYNLTIEGKLTVKLLLSN